jgi:hypothetical protein
MKCTCGFESVESAKDPGEYKALRELVDKHGDEWIRFFVDLVACPKCGLVYLKNHNKPLDE